MTRIKTSHAGKGMSKSDIAIIGMACRFPGAPDYRAYWENLMHGENSIREITNDRWDIGKYYSADIHEPNKSISKWCGLLDDADKFDCRFFNISPREAANIDPQQRLLLEETWHCIEDAGLTAETLHKKISSVYVGFMAMDYHQEAVAPDVLTESYACLGNYGSLLANRISYYFGLRGQSLAIDAACASTLVAIHHARKTLISGESDYAFVGAASLNFHPWKYISFSKSRMLSPDGQCKAFDQHANGYVPGDGVGVLLLQRMGDALKEGNHIYGIVKGSSVNHGGRTDSITSPRVEAQRDVIVAAYENAGLSAETVSYIEAHGTGTSLGDPIEIEALTQAFRKYTDQKQFCKIGSVKSNIGHLEAAAGLAGLIKVLLMMQHRMVPKTLNVTSVNPIINIADSPFEIARDLGPWKCVVGQPLRAGISSFGFGGVNSHVLVESFSHTKKKPLLASEMKSESECLFLLSAKSSQSLKKLLQKWKHFAGTALYSKYTLHDICATLMIGRTHFSHRFGVSVKSKEALEKILNNGSSSFTAGPPAGDWLMRVGSGGSGLKVNEAGVLFDQSLKRININIAAKVFPKRKAGQRTITSSPLEKAIVEDYVFLSALIEAGFSPKIITYQGNGFWVALAICAVIRLEDAFSVIAGRKNPNEILLRRPRIAFYDPVTGMTFKRYNFTQAYVRSLLNGYRQNASICSHDVSDSLFSEGNQTEKIIDETLFGQSREIFDDAFAHYVKKARILNRVQFTFKRYIDEWDSALRASGFAVTGLLAEERLLSDKCTPPSREKILLLVVIISSLAKLNKKWHLRDEGLPVGKGFRELVDLVIDEVMPKTTLAELFAKYPDYAKMADILNERQHFLNERKPYEYLRAHCRNLDEIKDFQTWIKKASISENRLRVDESTRCLEFGESIMRYPGEQSIFVDWRSDLSADKVFKDALFHLWLQGVDIHWEKLYGAALSARVALPGYEFEKKSFWLPSSQEIEPEGMQPSRFPLEILKSDQVIRDHIITGKNVIPGAYMIELCLTTVQKALKRPVTELNNVIMKNPGVVEKDMVIQAEIYPFEKRFILKKGAYPLCEGDYV